LSTCHEIASCSIFAKKGSAVSDSRWKSASRCAQRLEGLTHLVDEGLRLLQGRNVPAPIELVEMDELPQCVDTLFQT
jgi:hypothetical protein